MRKHPYRFEILGTLVLAPVVLGIEGWRRWGHWLEPYAMDDWLVFGSALVVVGMLACNHPLAPRLWALVCGGAWFLMALSLWGSIYHRADGDPSGVAMPLVLGFKGLLLALISVAAWRTLSRPPQAALRTPRASRP